MAHRLLVARREEGAMQAEIIQSMHDQVRAIYRAITGEDVSDVGTSEVVDNTEEGVTRRFAELEAAARPLVRARVPPFMFTPRVDVMAVDGAVVVEIELPGLDRDEIEIERRDGVLTISGVRRDGHAARGNMFHAEIPRGPFTRTIPLPFPLEGEPRIELDRGVLRLVLKHQKTNGQEGK